MGNRVNFLARAATIAALYTVLTHLQNAVWPGSANMAIQFRFSEALCVLAFFTPSAIPGLAVGCLLFNLTSGAALPFDFLVGSLATLLTAISMRHCRKVTLRGYPLPGLMMPALFNGVFIGAELTLTASVGGSFWLNALLVAVGETAVLLSLGTVLYYTLRSRKLHRRLFE